MSEVHKQFIGKTIGKVTIEAPLNVGGYGYSFIGYDEELQKKRVIKISKKPIVSLGNEENEAEIFKKEGIILARLKHPQIVSVVDQGELLGFRYLIIEHIEGFDFVKVISVLKQKQEELGLNWEELLDPSTALAIVKSALEPLAYAHNTKISIPGEEPVDGIAHRDISAGNLMLGYGPENEGKIHLIDFGTAKANINITSTVNIGVIGNVRYMSPMRLMKKGIKEGRGPYWKNFKQTQHDVHSMGCFLWELLAGDTHIELYDSEDLAAPLAAIQNKNTYRELYESAKIFDKDIQEIIRKSVVFPDLKSNRGAYQYLNAAEMLIDVSKAYDKYSGQAPVEKVLAHLAEEINEPGNLDVYNGHKSSRVTNYSKSKRIKSVFSKGKSNFKSYIPASVIAITLVLIGVLFIRNNSNSDNADIIPNRTEISTPLDDIFKEEEQSPVKAFEEKMVMVGETENISNEKENKTPQIIDRPPKVETKIKQERTSKLRPKIPKPKPQASNKKVEKVVVLEPLEKTQELERQKEAPLYEEFKKIIDLLNSGNLNNQNKAYKLTLELEKKIQDPALYILQAELLAIRNPNSPKIKFLINKAKTGTSMFMTNSQLRKRMEKF